MLSKEDQWDSEGIATNKISYANGLAVEFSDAPIISLNAKKNCSIVTRSVNNIAAARIDIDTLMTRLDLL